MRWLLIFLCSSALAGEVILTWTLPIENEDGTELTNLAGVRIYQMVHDTEDSTVTTWTHGELLPDDYTYVATAYTTELDEDERAVESIFSREAIKVVDPLKTVDETVYTVVRITNNFLMVPVGTVPIGTECSEGTTVNGHYGVPAALVTWSGNIQPTVVVAICS